jgi:hypothetical protein
MDKKRLTYEIQEIQRCPKFSRLVLYSDNNYSPNCWRHYSWEGLLPSLHYLQARYPENYPYAPLEIALTPDVQEEHHKLGRNICYIRPEEWSPSYRASTAITLAIVYIHKYHTGRLDE